MKRRRGYELCLKDFHAVTYCHLPAGSEFAFWFGPIKSNLFCLKWRIGHCRAETLFLIPFAWTVFLIY